MARLDKLGLQKLVENINKEINTKINSIKDTLANNVSYIEEITEWIFEDGLYKHTITHPLNTDRIEVTAIDTLTKERVLVGDQAIDKNTVVIKSDIEQNLTVMIINCESEIKALEIPLDDTSTSTLTTWSSEKIQSELDKKSTDAKSTTFDNSTNGMTSINVQDAIEENNIGIKTIDAEFDKPVNTQYSTINGIKEFECKDGYIDNVVIEGKTLVNLNCQMVNKYTNPATNTVVDSSTLTSYVANVTVGKEYTILKAPSNRFVVGCIDSIENGASADIVYHVDPDVNSTVCVKVTATKSKMMVYVANSNTNVNVLILEGDWTNKEIPPYFEGLKSVGQGDKIEVLTTTGYGLYKTYEYTALKAGVLTPTVTDNVDEFLIPDDITSIEVQGRTYTGMSFLDVAYNQLDYRTGQNGIIADIPKGTRYIRIPYLRTETLEVKINNIPAIKIEQYDKKRILSTLRSLPNGVKDIIYKQGDKYYKIKRCEEITLNGSENGWLSAIVLTNTIAFSLKINDNCIPSSLVFSDKFISIAGNDDIEHTRFDGNANTSIMIYINKNKLSSQDTAGFKTWLASNPVTVVYELATPIIEEIPNFNPRTFDNKSTLLLNSGVVQADCNFEVTNSLRSELEVLKAKTSDLDDYVVDEEVYYPTLLNGWVDVATDYKTSVFKQNNQCTISFRIKSGLITSSSTTLITVLPKAFTPKLKRTCYMFNRVGAVSARVVVYENGNIIITDVNSNNLSIDDYIINTTYSLI